MRKRLLLSYVLIALAAVLVLGLPLGIVGTRLVRSDAHARLEREAASAAALVDDDLEHGRPLPRARLISLLASDHALLIVGRDGAQTVAGPLPAGTSSRPRRARATAAGSPRWRRPTISTSACSGCGW